MSARRACILGFATLALLAARVSGTHAHIDEQGFVGGVESTHVHHVPAHSHGAGSHHDHHGFGHSSESPADDHDFEDTQDVSVVELTTGASTPALAAFPAFALPAPASTSRIRIFTFAYPVLSGRYTRWRPPLRAPPKLG